MGLLGGLLNGVIMTGYYNQANQQSQMNNLRIQEEQQQVETGKLQNQLLQTQMAGRSALTQASANLQGSGTQTYQKLIKVALDNGDYTDAGNLQSLLAGSQKSDLLEEEKKVRAAASSNQALSDSASSYLSNPNPQAQKDLVKAYISGGGDPKSIPNNSQGFNSWAQALQFKGLSVEKKAGIALSASRMAQVAADKELTIEMQRQRLLLEQQKASASQTKSTKPHQLNSEYSNVLNEGEASQVSADLAQMQKTGKFVDADGHPASYFKWLADNKGAQALLPEGYTPVDKKLTAAAAGSISQILSDGSVVGQSLQNMGKVVAGITGSVGSNWSSHTFLSAIGKNANQELAASQTQAIDVLSQGLGLDLSRIATLLGGRSGGDAVVQEFKALVKPSPGDTNGTVALRLAYASDIVKSRLHSLVGMSDMSTYQSIQPVLDSLDKLPSSTEVMSAITQGNKGTTYNSILEKIAKDAQKVKEGVGPVSISAPLVGGSTGQTIDYNGTSVSITGF